MRYIVRRAALERPSLWRPHAHTLTRAVRAVQDASEEEEVAIVAREALRSAILAGSDVDETYRADDDKDDKDADDENNDEDGWESRALARERKINATLAAYFGSARRGRKVRARLSTNYTRWAIGIYNGIPPYLRRFALRPEQVEMAKAMVCLSCVIVALYDG